MNCQECQDILDNLLVAEPSEAEHAALAEHLGKCPDCARQHAQARQALAAITPTSQFPVSHDLKERIMNAISDARVFQPVPTTVRVRRSRAWKTVAASAAAVALLVALLPFLRPGPGQRWAQRTFRVRPARRGLCCRGKTVRGKPDSSSR